MVSLIVNSAHAESLYTCLAFSQDGSYVACIIFARGWLLTLCFRKLYTGGEEGYVRIWRSDLGSEQEPDVATEGEDAITSISTSVSDLCCQ